MPLARLIVLTVMLAPCTVAAASAQVFGTFPWQMQPYCNTVTLTLTSTPAGWTLDGVDDQCGAGTRGAAVGIASFGASGNVALNFTIVIAPSGRPVHVSAVVSAANGNGTWTDSVGNSGTFAFFATEPFLPARPMPSSGLAPAVITTTEIAAGAVGASDINTAQVQSRVTGTCLAGQAVSAVNENGSVTCSSTGLNTQFRAAGHQPTSVPTNSFTAVRFATAFNEGGGGYNETTGVYTVPQTGIYLVTAAVHWAPFGAASGSKCIAIQNFNVGVGATICDAPSTAAIQIQSTSAVVYLTAGSLLRVAGYQTTGVGATFSTSSTSDTHFAVIRLR